MNLSLCRKILTLMLSLAISLSTLNFSAGATEPSVPNESVEVRNCVKLKTGKARLIDSSVKKCKKNEKLVFLKFPAGFIAPPSQPGPSGNGVLSGKGIPKADTGKNGDFYIDLDTYKIFGPKNEMDAWGEGKSLVGPQGPGGSGPRGPAGITTLGYYGAFYDTTNFTIPTVTPSPIPLNSDSFQDGVTREDGSKIKISNAGKYNIAFSSQLFVDASKNNGTVSIWLAKNGTAEAWSNTKLYVVKGQHLVASWNFYVSANADDYYQLMIISDAADVIIQSTAASGSVPGIPGTILTVNQVGQS
jgi:hypothetical protein